jgi:hypothetical protein
MKMTGDVSTQTSEVCIYKSTLNGFLCQSLFDHDELDRSGVQILYGGLKMQLLRDLRRVPSVAGLLRQTEVCSFIDSMMSLTCLKSPSRDRRPSLQERIYKS